LIVLVASARAETESCVALVIGHGAYQQMSAGCPIRRTTPGSAQVE
jgi:hypothetical protein